jgi:osmoprotectant transport system permease protein
VINQLQEMLRFIQDPANMFAERTVQTLQLSIVPILCSLLIAVPLGILVARRPIGALIATTLSGLGRAIPVLVLLVLMVSVFHIGIGFRPAAIALTILGIPPILLNTIEGLRSIDPAVVDAARGMGMTQRQILGRIQIPLMLPVLAAGVRTAAVQIVATSPLAAIIGAGGYGHYIVQGLSNLADPTELLVGATSVALLALGTEFALAAVQRAVTPAGVRAEPPAGNAGQAEEALAEGQVAA